METELDEKGMFFADPAHQHFPIPDRAHYTLALSQLNHASYPGFDKATVRASVLARGKAMGWTTDEAFAEQLADAIGLVSMWESEGLVAVQEADVEKSKGGKLLLRSIANHADHISQTANALHDHGSGYSSYGTSPTATDIPDANMMMTAGMHQTAGRLKKMTGMVNDAASALPNAAPPTPPLASDSNGMYDSLPLEIGADLIIESDASGSPVTIAFTEASGSGTVTKGEVKGRMIAAGFNKAKSRFYTPTALKEAVDKKMFVGKPMFLDHATEAESRSRPEGSVRNMAAVIQETSLNTDGSIAYTAKLADPQFQEKLAYMQKNGILGGIGVSIRAAGSGQRKSVDGTDTFMVEHFVEAYSTDFVTLPGAYGSIDLIESETPATTQPKNGEEIMDEKQLAALMESMAKAIGDSVATAVKPISESNERLISRMDAVEAQGRIKTLIESTDLHEASKRRLLTQFATATKVEGVAEAIEAERAYLTEVGVVAKKAEVAPPVKLAEARKLGQNPVQGLGAVAEDAAKKTATFDDLKESRVAGWFGGAPGVEKLRETLA